PIENPTAPSPLGRSLLNNRTEEENKQTIKNNSKIEWRTMMEGLMDISEIGHNALNAKQNVRNGPVVDDIYSSKYQGYKLCSAWHSANQL
uniref:Uncharacterized protein n=1 Tax=Romanomermis culicivorax TaxID=13658 RepID=A0A915JF57_ROMCU